MSDYTHPKAGIEANPDQAESTQRAGGDVVVKGPSQAPEGTPRAGGDVVVKGASQAPQAESRAGGDVVVKGASDANTTGNKEKS